MNHMIIVIGFYTWYIHNSYHIFIDREAREIMYLVASVRPFVSLFVQALLFELFDLCNQ